MIPRDIASLLDYLRDQREFETLTNSLLTAWGPADQPLLSADLLPPRPLEDNAGTIEEVYYRTVVAQDGTRHSPAQIVDGGEIWGKIHYSLGNSDIARQLIGPDYEGVLRMLGRGQGLAAAARVIGIFDQYIIQAMAWHDEIANWQALLKNRIQGRGNNGWFEYENGPTLAGHFVAAGDDWTDPDYDPWTEIIARINFLASLGYQRSGIRIYTTDKIMQTLAANPNTALRLYAPFPNNITPIIGIITVDDVVAVFRKLGVQAPIINDQHVLTKTGQMRSFEEGNMFFAATTSRTEEVLYNVDDPSQFQLVRGNLGFNGIGKANMQTSTGRRTATRSYENQKDARIEFEGWQSTGPIILEPTARTVISGIETI